MKLSDLCANNDTVKGTVATATANIAAQVTAIGVSDPGLSGGGVASLASITASVASINAAVANVRSGLQLRQDPPVRGE